MAFQTTVEVKTNLSITARERGKVVAKREGHNIFLDTGREWLAQLIGLQSTSPDVTYRDDRVRYIGFGIGGNRQRQLSDANAAPISPPYTGANTQTDTDTTVTALERPVRVSGSISNYPGISGDIWIGTIGSADPYSVPTQVTFRRLFNQGEISYGPFLSVPLSEVAMFTSSADPGNYLNVAVAYDTFPTISKTSAIELEVIWTFIIG